MAGFDTFAKRYYPFIVTGTLVAVAYFQASGISSLIAEQLKGSAPSKAASPEDSLAKLKRGKTGARSRSGQEILARNAFDSTTGPLVGRPPAPTASAAPTSRTVTHAEPPKCQSGEVKLIAGAVDPQYSFAVISTGTESHMRRVGDEVDGKKIESIIGETVVLAAGEDRCKMTMHDDQSPSSTSAAEPGARSVEPEEAPRSAVVRGSMSGIRRVSDTEFVIEDDGPQKVAQMQQAFSKSSKVVPGQGVRLYRSAQTTILGHLGMRKSDIVKSINGHDLSSDEQSKQAIAQLEGANDFQVVLERNGSPMTISIRVEK